jgi:hypothetical protein
MNKQKMNQQKKLLKLFSLCFVVFSMICLFTTINLCFMETTKTSCFIDTVVAEEELDHSQPWMDGFYAVRITGFPIFPVDTVIRSKNHIQVLLSDDPEEIIAATTFYAVHSQHACSVLESPYNSVVSIDAFYADEAFDERDSYFWPWIASLLLLVFSLTLFFITFIVEEKNIESGYTRVEHYDQPYIEQQKV